MTFAISTHLAYHYSEPTDVLLQIEAAFLPDQRVTAHHLDLGPVDYFARAAGHHRIGERIWLRLNGRLTINYTAEVTVLRTGADIGALSAVEPHLLPGETIDYLMPSRFCPSDQFYAFVEDEFGALQGGARIAAMRDWITSHLRYVPGASSSATTAADTLVQREGVCRDYAHVMVAMARASSIPARYASVYAPGVTPQDFHAVAEVFLGNSWHLIDATGMSGPADTAIIGVGRDAADIAFLSSFGSAEFVAQDVRVSPVAPQAG